MKASYGGSAPKLTAIGDPVIANIAYDGPERRTTKTLAGATTQYLYDGVNPVQELSESMPAANLVTGLGIDEYFRRTDAAGARDYLTEALGSPLALADSTGTVQTQYTYEPFGIFSAIAPTTSAISFTGREADGAGLVLYRARYYDPRRQRFISEDPV